MNRSLLFATLFAAALPLSAHAGNKPGKGVYILDQDIDMTLSRSHKSSPGGIGKVQVGSVSFRMWGPSDGTDKFQLTWKAGKKVVGTTTCRMPETEEDTDINQINCDVESSKILLAAGANQLDIAVKSAETGKVKLVTSVPFGLVSWNYNGYPTEKEWGMDYDSRLGLHYANWSEGALNLHSWVKFSPTVDRAPGKVKCTANGQAVTPQQSQTTLHRVHDQRDPKTNKEVIYGELEAMFAIDPKDAPVGPWACTALFNGKAMRVFKFELDANHQIVVSPEQANGKIVHPFTVIPKTEMPANADAKRR